MSNKEHRVRALVSPFEKGSSLNSFIFGYVIAPITHFNPDKSERVAHSEVANKTRCELILDTDLPVIRKRGIKTLFHVRLFISVQRFVSVHHNLVTTGMRLDGKYDSTVCRDFKPFLLALCQKLINLASSPFFSSACSNVDLYTERSERKA